jgi:hypothetical protein
MPELTQLLSGKSMILSLPPNGTAGLDRPFAFGNIAVAEAPTTELTVGVVHRVTAVLNPAD